MKKVRRKFTAAFQAQVALEALKERQTLAALAEKFELHPNQISQWKQKFLENSPKVFTGTEGKEKEQQCRIGYQSRKAANSCNSLFLADNKGLMLTCNCPLAGQHHDLFQIKQVFEELCGLLHEAGMETNGLFLNADAGFDSQEFRQQCAQMKIEANIARNPRNAESTDEYVYFDEQLFKRRKVIEQANAWLDSFKALLIRFETKAQHWLVLHFLAFAVQLIRKFNKKQKR